MTAPIQQPDQQQQDQSHLVRDAVIAAIAAWLASKLAIGAVRLPSDLVGRLVALGLSRKAILRAGQLGLSLALSGRGPHGSPKHVAPGRETSTPTVRWVKATEPERRAEYIVTAAERLTEREKLGVGEQAERVESTYAEAQRNAARNRINAAQELDRAAARSPGGWLIWVTKHDDRVEAECEALEGRVFTPDNLPKVAGRPVLPGAVHPRCRCRAEPFHAAPLTVVSSAN